jgi:uncharacterized membrane protein
MRIEESAPRHASGERIGALRMPVPVRIAGLYFVFTSLCGMALILFDRRPSRNDEGQHWRRACQIASGQLRALPNPANPAQYGSIDAHGGFLQFNNTAVYSPFLYFPSALAPGRYHIASALTLLCCAALTALAIALSGRLAMLMAMAALMPTVFLSYLYPTADAVNTSVALLFIGLTLHLKGSGRRWLWILAALTACAAMLGATKPTNLALLVLLAVCLKRGDALRNALLALPALAALAPALLWHHATRMIAPGVKDVAGVAAAQHQLLSHPVLLLESIGRSLVQPLDVSTVEGGSNITRNVQLVTGSEFALLPLPVMAPILVAFVLAGIGAARHAPCSMRWAAGAALCAFLALTVLAMVSTWLGTPGGYAEGMQSRYFAPVLPLAAMLMPGGGLRIYDERRLNMDIMGLTALTYAGLLLAHLLPFA